MRHLEALGAFLYGYRSTLSLAISFAIYSMVWSPTFAAILLGMLVIHEVGHLWAARRLGVAADMPIFLPFVGAFINITENKEDADRHWKEAVIAIAGPAFGTTAAIGCLILGEYLNSPVLIAAAIVGFILNMFNLLPALPLDGGRIFRILPKAINIPAYAFGAFAIGYIGNYFIGALLLFGAVEMVSRPAPPNAASLKLKVGLSILVAVMVLDVFLYAGAANFEIAKHIFPE